MSPALTYEQLTAFLTPKLPFYLDLLAQMVRINSFTSNWQGVNQLGDLTATGFAELGFTTARVPSVNPQYGNHLVLTRPGRSGRKIGLVTHLDTVFPPDEEARNDFSWRREGERVYGPGTVDIKGGTVVIYMMLDAIRALAPDVYNDVTWIVLADASEEAEAADFGALCVEKLAPDALACLVFEGGYVSATAKELNVVVARKGMAVYRLLVDGKGAHAGAAHALGANAIVQMADVIQKVAAMTDYERNLTFNVGTVAGGTVVNRVPHLATATVEMRVFDPVVYDEALARMLALNGYASVFSQDGFACQVSVEVMRRLPAWPVNPETDRLFDIWARAAATAGFRAIREHRGGLSDGNHFWHALPTLDALGPSGGNAHCSERSADGSKDQEFALVPSFVPKAALNALGILALTQLPPHAPPVA